MKQICSLVSIRSARLIAAAICGMIAHLQRDKPKEPGQPPPRNCIAVDGGVLVRYKFYRELLVQGVREILGDAVADQVPSCLPCCGQSCARAVLVNISVSSQQRFSVCGNLSDQQARCQIVCAICCASAAGTAAGCDRLSLPRRPGGLA